MLPKFLRDGVVVGPEEYPRGTVERAKSLSLEIVSKFTSLTTTEKLWKALVEEAEKEQVHTIYKFPTFDDYLRELIGVDKQTAEKLKKQGRPKKGEEKGSDATFIGRGTDYLRARLNRDHPDIAKALDRGEYPSVRQAAIAAGIVKVPTPLERIQRLYDNLSPADRETFLLWVNQRGV